MLLGAKFSELNSRRARKFAASFIGITEREFALLALAEELQEAAAAFRALISRERSLKQTRKQTIAYSNHNRLSLLSALL